MFILKPQAAVVPSSCGFPPPSDLLQSWPSLHGKIRVVAYKVASSPWFLLLKKTSDSTQLL